MKIRNSALAGIALAATAALGLTACGGSTTPAATGSSDATAGAGNGEITVYNAQHESLTKEWIDGFTAETGIKVTMRQGSDTELSNQIIQEGAASPADVFLTENSPAMTQVENADLFADVDEATIAQVPEEFRPSTGKWTGIAARSTVLVYDKNKLTEDQLPKSMLDLATPEWKGKWAASPSGADFQAIVSALLELKGEAATEEWLKGMKENFKAYKGNSTAMKAVNAGEVDAALIYHYYYYGDQAKTGENSNNVTPYYFKNQDPGAFVSVSGGGVLKTSKNQEAAQEFLKYVTGKKGQEILKDGTSFEYAIASDVPANEKLVPIAELQAPTVDPAKLNSEKVTELMTSAGLL
ncbi:MULTISPECIES: iron ABC transporter substrate-binding protein [Pseudarthrobacter]|jgi:iron(III) transport system substrate-binding protein|uniref:Iron(III) transport system substrate-binding protein n=1 Tax=Pseudarthrobacter oxydans TaxID=1671 RepID=A0AAW8NCI7_PSEOX|nr:MULTISPECIES: iron ABC transporter substrate-binding protein [Pseudarthrobacter]MDV2981055.1 iron ABC transporter substrate-binding protein [Actinomycetes bacterium ARC8]WHP60078.1 iron ABC transporter substrate-binding protein [Arthrobacter sp. KFRI-F3372]MDR6792658.1 iron(III) transport system substrate-binding protein [Pseudarthrobacter oxydans]MDR7164084.1 iron(III) transport system substrate-binding protein [Pseudarthrobacter oxydans]NSX37863.1 iron ABC transporter substrate-binding pr